MPPESPDDLTTETHRTLTGWLPEDEGIQLLLGRAPTPTDDLAAITQQLSDRRAAVAAREPFEQPDPLVEPEDRAALDAVASRPEVRAAFSGMEGRLATGGREGGLAVQEARRANGV